MERVFFPVPDANLIRSSSNSTYWIPLVVRLEWMHGFEYVYYVSIVIEIVFILTTMIVLPISTVRLKDHGATHPNLMHLGKFIIVLFEAGMVARLMIICVENGIVRIGIGDITFVVFVGLRTQAFIACAWFMSGAVLERTLATHYVATYESDTHPSLMVIGFITYAILVWLLTVMLVGAFTSCIIVGFLMLLPNFVAIFAIRKILNDNKCRLHNLEYELKKGHYSLSLRAQLRENIWTITEMLTVAPVAFVMMCLGIPAIFIPPIVLNDPSLYWLLQVLVCLENVAIAGGVPIVFIATIIAFERIRKVLVPERVIVLLFRKAKPSLLVRREIRSESIALQYFEQLKEQWA